MISLSQSLRYEITADTEFAQFQEILKPYPEVAERVDDENLKLTFEHVSLLSRRIKMITFAG
jgi:hypothetical protein